ncbi:hypothetical protein Fmac_018599 [Flemingia macrophylla]|uniref:Ribosomal protein S14 n=1 Tax=Flemingia macrophylla TaxID=520843 RepID=A0ABD1M5H9_9FABA
MTLWPSKMRRWKEAVKREFHRKRPKASKNDFHHRLNYLNTAAKALADDVACLQKKKFILKVFIFIKSWDVCELYAPTSRAFTVIFLS